MIEANQLVWEQRANALNQSMLYLMNSKNENAKKDLRLAYSQGNNTAYPFDIESMARYLSTQYPNKNSVNQRNGKKEDISGKKGRIRNLKTKTVTQLAPQEHTLETPHQMKSQLLLAEEPV